MIVIKYTHQRIKSIAVAYIHIEAHNYTFRNNVAYVYNYTMILLLLILQNFNMPISVGLPGWGIFLIIFFVMLLILGGLLLFCLLFYFLARRSKGQYNAEKRGK